MRQRHSHGLGCLQPLHMHTLHLHTMHLHTLHLHTLHLHTLHQHTLWGDLSRHPPQGA